MLPETPGTASTRNGPERGFTLLELMVTLTVMGIGFALVTGTFFFSSPPMPRAGEAIVREAAAVRSQAMLRRVPATLGFADGPTATVLTADGKRSSLPDGVRLVAVNGKAAREAELVFHPFGLVPETLLHLELARPGSEPERLSVFFPGAEAAFFLPGFQDRAAMARNLVN